MIVYGGYLTYEYFIKGTEKNNPKPAFGKIRNIYRDQCALYPDHTGRFESNGSGTRNLIHLNPLTATSATVETLGISHTVVYYLSTFILSLILSVLNIGLLKIALDTARGYDIRFQDLFFGFKHHPDRAILAQGVILLLTYLCILPGSTLCICGYRQKSVTLLLAGAAVLCVGLVIYLILSLMFSQTMFFLTDYIDIEAMQALKESVRIMRGKKGKLFYLQLSFIGIYLLGAIACGIGLLWVIPYMQVTMANFYRKITGEI